MALFFESLKEDVVLSHRKFAKVEPGIKESPEEDYTQQKGLDNEEQVDEKGENLGGFVFLKEETKVA